VKEILGLHAVLTDIKENLSGFTEILEPKTGLNFAAKAKMTLKTLRFGDSIRQIETSFLLAPEMETIK